MSQAAKLVAQDLLTSLGADFSLPALDLSHERFNFPDALTSPFSEQVGRPTTEELTSGTVRGDGSFDKIMVSQRAHLKEEYEKGTITGEQYAKTYIELTSLAMNAAVTLLTTSERTYWESRLIQMQGRRAEIEAVSAMVQLETAKAELMAAQSQAKLVNAQYVLTQMQTAQADSGYRLNEAQILQADAQTLQVQAQTSLTGAQEASVAAETSISGYRLNFMLPKELEQLTAQVDLTGAQKLAVDKDVEVTSYQLSFMLPQQLNNLVQENSNMVSQKSLIDEQVATEQGKQLMQDSQTNVSNKQAMLIHEQTCHEQIKQNLTNAQTASAIEQNEVSRAQTMDTRRDGSPVSGVVKRQKDHLEAQTNTEIVKVSLTTAQTSLVNEQMESQRGQTQDTRTDNAPVVGMLGKQKDLYNQQIDSYQKDAKHKVGKMYLDAWITQKTMDEGLLAPAQLTNEHIDSVLAKLRENNELHEPEPEPTV